MYVWIYNWQLHPSSKCDKIDENVRFWIWRFAVAPPDVPEMSAQLQSLRCTKSQKLIWKIYFLGSTYFYGAHKFVRSEPLLDWLSVRSLTLGVGTMYRRAEKFLYRWTSTFSALNHCGGSLLNYFCYLFEVVRTNFSPIFRLFSIFIFFSRKWWRQLTTKMRTI